MERQTQTHLWELLNMSDLAFKISRDDTILKLKVHSDPVIIAFQTPSEHWPHGLSFFNKNIPISYNLVLCSGFKNKLVHCKITTFQDFT